MSSLFSELAEEGLVPPDFERSNFAVTRQLIKSTKGSLIGEKDKKIFIILDGVGYDLLKSLLDKEKELAEKMSEYRMEKITSVFPTATMTAMSCIYSGLTPAEHGVAASNLFIREIGMTVNTIWITPSANRNISLYGTLDISTLFPKSELVAKTKSRKKTIKLVQMDKYSNTGISSVIFSKEDTIPYTTPEAMFTQIADLAKEGVDIIMGYNDMVDRAQHSYHPAADESYQTLHKILESMNRILLPAAKEYGYNIIITADHGHVTNNPVKDAIYTVDTKLLNLSHVPPWGDSRNVILDIDEKKEKEFMQYMKEKIGNKAVIIRSDEAISAGLFGKTTVSEDLRYRFGSHLLIPKGGLHFMLSYSRIQGNLPDKRGMHGGLDPHEMYIPLLIY